MFIKVASCHYLPFTLQSYNQPYYQFRSCLTQMTSPSDLNTQSRVQPRHTYNHTYILKIWTKHNHLTLNPDKPTCTVFTPDPVDYKSNLELKKKQHYTTHGNSPKGYWSYIRLKTHKPHTHSQHLSTRTQPLQIIRTLTATA